MNEQNKEYKVVKDPKLARKLCKKGHYIVDIKKKKGSYDASVFIFEKNEQFDNDLKEISAQEVHE